MPSQQNSPRFAAERRLGSETPRIWTKSLRELTPETSKGFAAIEFAEEILEVTLYPWQKWLLIHALETLDDGSYRFRTVVLLVARQNGKSLLMLVLALWRMYADGAPLVIGTAQNLDISEELWSQACEMAESIPELAVMIEHVDKTNGKKALRLTTGERYKVAAASRRGGRGLSGDLILLDELREHQSFDAWASVTKTTMARAFAQVWAASNAGDAASIVLRFLRMAAHLALGDPDGINADLMGVVAPADEASELEEDSLGIFEWSAIPGCSIWDREGWAMANPSMGHVPSMERAIVAAAKTDPEWVLRTEVLCQWFAGSSDGPFPSGSWQQGIDEDSRVSDGQPVVACIDLSWDRSIAHIAFAGFRDDGIAHAEVVASRAGVDWVIPWLTSPDRTRVIRGVVWQVNGAPVSSLTDELKKSDLPLIEWQGADLGRATGSFYDLVRQVVPVEDQMRELSEQEKSDYLDTLRPGVYHRSQPLLDVAANTAVTKPSGDSWLWDRAKSPTDIAPLVALTGATWGLLNKDFEPERSAYEDDSVNLMVLD